MPGETKSLEHGVLIAFEGIDGCGKSTQVRLLGERLSADGYPVVSLREPTAALARRIAALTEAERGAMTPGQELQLFIDDRREHVERRVLPALEAGRVVLLDRYYLSTAAYQGTRGLDPTDIIRANETFAPRPDVFFVLELPINDAMKRIRVERGSALTVFEKRSSLKAVAEMYRLMAHDRILRIDASRSTAEVRAVIEAAVRDLLMEITR